MAQNSDRRISSTPPDFVKTEDTPGLRIDTGPYLGLVKNNLDPTRSGRLQVWIPDLSSGDENEPSNWRTVSYASPFMGTTFVPPGEKRNSFTTTGHTYGMWFNVPDIDNFVLCTFIAGNPQRGFWFACVSNQIGHHMIPAISSTTIIDSSTIQDSQIKKIYKPGMALPVVEFNENDPDARPLKDFTTIKKPLHEVQVKNLIKQGLDRHKLTGSRGIIYSQTQRETPSGVFGVSTPGRPFNRPMPGPASTEEDLRIPTRKGGHTFVMDDGDVQGLNNLVRLRTSAGHQVLMDDSERIVYISNSDGSTWVELTGSGHINIYGSSSMNVRVKQDINFHADKDVNIQAGGDINLRAEKNVNVHSSLDINMTSVNATKLYGATVGVGSDGRIDLYARSGGSFTAVQQLLFTGKPIGLNSGTGPTVIKPASIKVYNHSDTRIDDNGQWQIQNNSLKSISKIVPSHEPWPRREGVASVASGGTANGGPIELGTSGGASGNSSSSENGTVIADPKQPAPTVNIIIVDCENNTVTSSGGPVTDSSGRPVITGTAANLDPGPKDAASRTVQNPVPSSSFKQGVVPNPPAGIGALTQLETRALLTQLAYGESSFDYKIVNSLGYAGRYQFGASALASLEYIKNSAVQLYGGNRAMNYASSWTGKNGVNSLNDWLANHGAQESAVYELMKKNYESLTKNGGIKNGDDKCSVAGMLLLAHNQGAGGAANWRKTGNIPSPAGGLNPSGHVWFNRGRYAIDRLAKGQ